MSDIADVLAHKSPGEKHRLAGVPQQLADDATDTGSPEHQCVRRFQPEHLRFLQFRQAVKVMRNFSFELSS